MKTQVIVILDLRNLVLKVKLLLLFPCSFTLPFSMVKYNKLCLLFDRCFMWYVDKIMQFINRNAYIIVAVKGSGYCTSAGRAIKLIVNNALRLVAVNIIVDVVVW